MSEKLILEALQTATISAVAASIMNELPIKMLGRSFVVPGDDKYLEVIHIPNNIAGEHWGTEKTFRGVYRLILHWPIDDKGSYQPMDIITSIASFFTKGLTLRNGAVSVKITEEPDASGQISTRNETLYPVSMRYQFFRVV